MIGTHASKVFNAKVKQSGVCADLIDPPPDTISSATVTMRRKYFALPSNAAVMAEWRKRADPNVLLKSKTTPETVLPEIQDGNIKQLLIPRKDWREDEYLAVCPVASLGVVYEIHRRLFEAQVPFRRWIIQPTPAAITNHGESLLLQGGAVRMFICGSRKTVRKARWRGNYVMLECDVVGMNISGGMVALGWPAVTALGGLVHMLERETGIDLNFAFGMSNCYWNQGLKKTNNRTATGVSPGFDTSEVTAGAHIYLLLRPTDDSVDLEKIATALRNITRISGGAIFSGKVSIHKNEAAPQVPYLIDATDRMHRAVKVHRIAEEGEEGYIDQERQDILDVAIGLYSKGGRWMEKRWRQPPLGYFLNMTGYAFLHPPISDGTARGEYPRVWAEPVFSIVRQGTMENRAWWRRVVKDTGYVQWKNG